MKLFPVSFPLIFFCRINLVISEASIGKHRSGYLNAFYFGLVFYCQHLIHNIALHAREELPAFRLVDYMTGKTPRVIRTCWLKFLQSGVQTSTTDIVAEVDLNSSYLVLNPRILA